MVKQIHNGEFLTCGELSVAKELVDLVNQSILPGTGVEQTHFWKRFGEIVHELAPVNRHLLAMRDELQAKIDEWHRNNDIEAIGFDAYKAFLFDIGYLLPEIADFEIETTHVDSEIAEQAGPQLVVPITNARFALNAVNSRWGSLYDALYGTDVIDDADGAMKGASYNPLRGQKVIAYGREFLDASVPLQNISHQDVDSYQVIAGEFYGCIADQKYSLKDVSQFVGYQENNKSLTTILLKNNYLHLEIQVDSTHNIGAMDKANVKDILIEAALTTIMDCEDSVATVDASDKVQAYRNWLGLMKGDLQDNFEKAGKTVQRRMNPDRQYIDRNGKPMSLKGRSLLFIRNVGHLMTNPAVIDNQGNEVPEGIMDAMITSLIAMHDLNGRSSLQNSVAGSINIVKPKMHGPQEVAFTEQLFSKVEQALGLPNNTIKVGIMDEERRTSVNLKQCIHAVKERVVFINTGFLDRTGDEIHTSMEAGAFAPKTQLKSMTWISAYENSNVDIGLACGLAGKAQIGKGMWAEPDNMSAMMSAKLSHVTSGASTAWVPSPTAATLHALHYHQVNIRDVQSQTKQRTAANVDDILSIPLLADSLDKQQIQRELDNNVQGILGYVVRWIDQGVGCSKVPDINHVGLMEDRATLRISSQHIANWLRHGILEPQQVLEAMQRMAEVVDGQNSSDPYYQNMSPDFAASYAFQAAKELVFEGTSQPNGYTEPALHRWRQKAKGCF